MGADVGTDDADHLSHGQQKTHSGREYNTRLDSDVFMKRAMYCRPERYLIKLRFKWVASFPRFELGEDGDAIASLEPEIL